MRESAWCVSTIIGNACDADGDVEDQEIIARRKTP